MVQFNANHKLSTDLMFEEPFAMTLTCKGILIPHMTHRRFQRQGAKSSPRDDVSS
jgi:hypothetical protein